MEGCPYPSSLYSITGRDIRLSFFPAVGQFALPAVFHYITHVLQCPTRHLVYKRNQRPPHLRKAVLDTRRHHGIGLAAYEAICLKHTQRSSQDARRDIGYLASELVESNRSLLVEYHYNQECPFVADTRYDIAHRAYLYDRILFSSFHGGSMFTRPQDNRKLYFAKLIAESIICTLLPPYFL